MIIDTQMQKGVVEGCVLKLISEREIYSSEIVSMMRERGFETFSEGTLYPLLLRMEKEGYLLFRKEEIRNGPSRKYYSLSNGGRERLEEFKNQWKYFYELINTIIMGE